MECPRCWKVLLLWLSDCQQQKHCLVKVATGRVRRQQQCWVLKPQVLLGTLLLVVGPWLAMGMLVMLQVAVLGLVERQLVWRRRRPALAAPLGSVHKWSGSSHRWGSPC